MPMRDYRYDHVHLRSADPEAMARFFEDMFGAEVTRGVYPPGTLYPGQLRVSMRLGGQTVLVAPKHPHEPTGEAPQFPYYGIEHIGLTVDDVDAAVDELKAKGAEVPIGPLTRNPGLRLAFVRGPEGIMVELVQRPEAATALQAPARQIALNAGFDGAVVAGKILEKDNAALLWGGR
jgi:catechol 2,3-dioxygenase-like lactoylglutathione lyase family enzyme